MKNSVKSLLSIVLVFAVLFTAIPLCGVFGVEIPGAAKAEALSIGVLPNLGDERQSGNFIFEEERGYAILRGYIGFSWDTVVVPGEFDGLPVKIKYGSMSDEIFEKVIISQGVEEIGAHAFSRCKYLESIELSSTVKVIEGMPYDTPLKEIKVAESNADFASVDGVLFSKDMTKLICFPSHKLLKGYNVPDGVKLIGKLSFYQSRYIQTVALPDSVTEFEQGAFSGTGVKNVIIPDSIEKLGKNSLRSNGLTVYYEGTQAQWQAIEGVAEAFGEASPTVLFEQTQNLPQADTSVAEPVSSPSKADIFADKLAFSFKRLGNGFFMAYIFGVFSILAGAENIIYNIFGEL